MPRALLSAAAAVAAALLVPAARAALPSPTCALNGLPCAPPTWAPTWNLTQSTVCQPSGNSYFMPNHTWGLVSLDWSVSRSNWFIGGNTSNTTCEATSRKGCQMLKDAGKATRCFIYHNSELALEWLETQREAINDPTKQDYFLQYLPGNPGNKPVGTVYDEPRAEGRQLFWNHSNPAAVQYYITSVLASLEADGGVADGSFTDDVDGLPAEHPAVQAAIGMSDDALAALIQTLTLSQKFNWQAFGSDDTSVDLSAASAPKSRAARGPAMIAGPTRTNCLQVMRTYCQAAYQGRPMLMKMDNTAPNANQTVAAFLIVRPPYAYIGYGWESDDRAQFWSPLFYLQAGTPLGLCTEEPSGVFSRVWSEGTASLDCAAWAAELPFASL